MPSLRWSVQSLCGDLRPPSSLLNSLPQLVKAPRPRPSPNLSLAARPARMTRSSICRGESSRASLHAPPVDPPPFATIRAWPCLGSRGPFCGSRWRFSPLTPRNRAPESNFQERYGLLWVRVNFSHSGLGLEKAVETPSVRQGKAWSNRMKRNVNITSTKRRMCLSGGPKRLACPSKGARPNKS
jgi:hypothetical protein